MNVAGAAVFTILFVWTLIEASRVTASIAFTATCIAVIAILTLIGRVQRIRYRDLATVVIPVLLGLTSFSLLTVGLARSIGYVVVVCAGLAVVCLRRPLRIWLGIVAPGSYRQASEGDTAIDIQLDDAYRELNEVLASTSSSDELRQRLSSLTQLVQRFDIQDPEWEADRQRLLDLLIWFHDHSAPTADDVDQARSRLTSLRERHRQLFESRASPIGLRRT